MEFECIGVANVQVNVVFCYGWLGDGGGLLQKALIILTQGERGNLLNTLKSF